MKIFLRKIRNNIVFIKYISVIRNFPLIICLHRIKDSIFLDSLLGLFLLPFSLLFFFFIRARYSLIKPIYKIVGVVIIKDEGSYIKELVEYYKLIKFDKLYLFDNESSDDTIKVLQPYIDCGFVAFNSIKGRGRQRDVYNIYLNKYGYKTIYATFFDADEFLKIPCDSAYEIIDKCFSSYGDKIGAIGINWVIFGTSGFEKKPNGEVIMNYLHRTDYSFGLNKLLKFVGKTKNILSIRNPHYPYLSIGKVYINQNGETVCGPLSHFTNTYELFFYHYYTKSKEEYYKRIQKGNALTGDKTKAIEDLYFIDSNSLFDDSLLLYVKERINEVN